MAGLTTIFNQGGGAAPEVDLSWMRVYELEDWDNEDVEQFIARLIEEQVAEAEPPFVIALDADDEEDELDALPAQIFEETAAAAEEIIQALFDDIDDVNEDIDELLGLVPDESGPKPEPAPTDGAVWPLPKYGRRAKRRHAPTRDRARLPEDIYREQRMVEEYLQALEAKNKLAPATSAPIVVDGTPAALEPRLTDAMVRAASAEQLMMIICSAAAAEIDRQIAVEEEHRREMKRRRTLLLLLVID